MNSGVQAFGPEKNTRSELDAKMEGEQFCVLFNFHVAYILLSRNAVISVFLFHMVSIQFMKSFCVGYCS